MRQRVAPLDVCAPASAVGASCGCKVTPSFNRMSAPAAKNGPARSLTHRQPPSGTSLGYGHQGSPPRAASLPCGVVAAATATVAVVLTHQAGGAFPVADGGGGGAPVGPGLGPCCSP